MKTQYSLALFICNKTQYKFITQKYTTISNINLKVVRDYEINFLLASIVEEFVYNQSTMFNQH